MKDFIPYGRQSISSDDVDSVLKILESDYLTQGPTIEKFENAITKKIGSNYAVCCNSATSALHISCMALGIKNNDIVWTSPTSFVASANCALYCGANIDFVDIDKKTGLISIDKLIQKLEIAKLQNKLPSLLIPVHLSGSSCDMSTIKDLSNIYGFKILEDASHALGGKYNHQYVGSCKYSDITVFSLHPVKIITSGEGGIATTNCELLANKLSKLRSHGIEKNNDNFLKPTDKVWVYEQQMLGYNYRMTDIHAALGMSQLSKLDDFVKERNKILKNYKKLFEGINLVDFLKVDDNVYSSFHLAVLLLKNKSEKFHQEMFNYLRCSNIGVQIHYIPIHLQPYYLNLGFKEGDFPEAESYANSAISIPVFPGLDFEDQLYIVEKISAFFKDKQLIN